MDTQANPARPSRWKRRLKIAGCVLAVLGVSGWWFVKSHPLVFNESFWGHRHCMKLLGLSLLAYANDNADVYPAHAGGYGDALLLLRTGTNDYAGWSGPLTGPGYDAKVFDEAFRTRGHVPESECGRVYVQGLKESSNPEIAIVWDKQPSPGDHRHGPGRIFGKPLREVWLVGGGLQMIAEASWPEFSRRQIELLVKEGIPRERAEALYAEKPKPIK